MSKFVEIEKAFSELKKKQSPAELTLLSHHITAEFKKTIRCKILDVDLPLSRFIMSTTPDTTTLDRVLDYAADNSSKVATIVGIWQGANKWELEINKQVLSLLSAKELTALTCHELWHVIYSDRTVNRIKDGLLFALNTSKLTRSAVITSEKFRKVLRIPGLVSCQLIFNNRQIAVEALQHKKYIEREMRADSFAAEKGYRAALVDAITKLQSAIGSSVAVTTGVASISAARVLTNLNERKTALARTRLSRLKNSLPGSVLAESVDEMYNDWFDPSDTAFNESFNPYTYAYTNPVSLQMYEESSIFSKRLEPIQRNQIDYAWVKAASIRNYNDQMMILSYVDSKLELVEWYLAIVEDVRLSKKYRVPHNKQELIKIRLRLEAVREKILNTRIAYSDGYDIYGNTGEKVVVYYPQGYEG